MEALSEDAPHTLLWEGPAESLGKAIARAATFSKEAISSMGAKEVLGIAAAAYAFHRLILTRPKLDLQGALVLVSGPVEGLGQEVINVLAGRGANVIVVSSEEELLKDLQEDSNFRRGGKIMCALCDPLDGDAMATLERDVTKNIGLPDVIICIPALRGEQSIDLTGYGSVRSAIEGELGSAMMTARAFHHKMVERGEGIIAIVVEGHKARGGGGVGESVRAGLLGLYDALSADAWGSGVHHQRIEIPEFAGGGQGEGCCAQWIVDAIVNRETNTNLKGRKFYNIPAETGNVSSIKRAHITSSMMPRLSYSDHLLSQSPRERIGKWIQEGDKTRRYSGQRGGGGAYGSPNSGTAGTTASASQIHSDQSTPFVSPVKSEAHNHTSLSSAATAGVPQLMGGVGIMVSLEHNGIQIVAIETGSPIAISGQIEKGNVIESVDGQDVGTSVERAKALLRGPVGTSVTLSVKTSGPTPRRTTVRLTRAATKDSSFATRLPHKASPTVSPRSVYTVAPAAESPSSEPIPASTAKSKALPTAVRSLEMKGDEPQEGSKGVVASKGTTKPLVPVFRETGVGATAAALARSKLQEEEGNEEKEEEEGGGGGGGVGGGEVPLTESTPSKPSRPPAVIGKLQGGGGGPSLDDGAGVGKSFTFEEVGGGLGAGQGGGGGEAVVGGGQGGEQEAREVAGGKGGEGVEAGAAVEGKKKKKKAKGVKGTRGDASWIKK